MAEIQVETTRDEPPYEFSVEVAETGGSTLHDVTVQGRTYERLTDGQVPPERFAEACFKFLLDRESKESILSRFDAEDIAKHFPEFEEEIGGYL